MSTVEDILMQKGSDVIGVVPGVTVSQAVQKMIDANVGCVVVQQDSKIVGIFTERDLLRRVVGASKNPDSTVIGDVMSSPVHSCTPWDDAAETFDDLSANHYRHLVVVDNGEPVGVISLRDVALKLREAEGNVPVVSQDFGFSDN